MASPSFDVSEGGESIAGSASRPNAQERPEAQLEARHETQHEAQLEGQPSDPNLEVTPSFASFSHPSSYSVTEDEASACSDDDCAPLPPPPKGHIPRRSRISSDSPESDVYLDVVNNMWSHVKQDDVPVPPLPSLSQCREGQSPSILMMASSVPLPSLSPPGDEDAPLLSAVAENSDPATPTEVLVEALPPTPTADSRSDDGTASRQLTATPKVSPPLSTPKESPSQSLRAAGDPLSPARMAVGMPATPQSVSPTRAQRSPVRGVWPIHAVRPGGGDHLRPARLLGTANFSGHQAGNPGVCSLPPLSSLGGRDLGHETLSSHPTPRAVGYEDNPFCSPLPPPGQYPNNPFASPPVVLCDDLKGDPLHRRAESADSPLSQHLTGRQNSLESLTMSKSDGAASPLRQRSFSHSNSGETFDLAVHASPGGTPLMFERPQCTDDAVALGVAALEQQEQRREAARQWSEVYRKGLDGQPDIPQDAASRKSKRKSIDDVTGSAAEDSLAGATPQSAADGAEATTANSEPLGPPTRRSNSIVGMLTPRFRVRKSSSVHNLTNIASTDIASVKKLKRDISNSHDHISSETSKIVYDKETRPNWDIFRKESYDDRSNPLLSGYLLKRKTKSNTWQKRFFETYGDYLTYYHTKKRKKIVACLDLCKVGEIAPVLTDKTGTTFFIEIADSPYFLRAESESICKDWVINLNRLREARVELGQLKLVTDVPAVRASANRERSHALRSEDFGAMEAELRDDGGDLGTDFPPSTPLHRSDRYVGAISSITPAPSSPEDSVPNSASSAPPTVGLRIPLKPFSLGKIDTPKQHFRRGRPVLGIARWHKRRSRLSMLGIALKRWANSILKLPFDPYKKKAVHGLMPVLEDADRQGGSVRTGHTLSSDLESNSNQQVGEGGDVGAAIESEKIGGKERIVLEGLAAIKIAPNPIKSSIWGSSRTKVKRNKSKDTEELLTYEDSEFPVSTGFV